MEFPDLVRNVDIAKDVPAAFLVHPLVRDVRLVGSRATGDAGPLSDWDFRVESADLTVIKTALPDLAARLNPLVKQWDRLARSATYMLILPGAIKVDVLLDEPHDPEPPWSVRSETLRPIDGHFWDWTLWLAGKRLKGDVELVTAEMDKMLAHLLSPMGVVEAPGSLEEAVEMYRDARELQEARLGAVVDRALEREVAGLLRRHGFQLLF